LNIQTPSRICLFGEHQDYLGLPVIAMAVSLYSWVKGSKNRGKEVIINKPDINETECFSLDDISYTNERDYYKSGIKVCQDEGLQFSVGFDVEVTSDIPIQAGCSSSSSIMVGWIQFLSQMANEPINLQPNKIAELAYKAEVLEFSEPGGMMDQYSTSLGGMLYLESEPKIAAIPFNPIPGTFVLGDSMVKKDTQGTLRRCKNSRLEIIKKLNNNDPEFSLNSIDMSEITNFAIFLTKSDLEILRGTINNRDILRQALVELQSINPHYPLIGRLLTKHHTILRDVLKVSTSNIEAMLEAALNAGALGGKINGSGGGGCMFAYAPKNPEAVAEAIEKVGGKAHIVESAAGSTLIS